MTPVDLRSRYVSWFGLEPTPDGEIEQVEEELGVRFPRDFRDISRFYSGGMLGGISHNAIAARGPATNITEETKRLRGAVGLPRGLIVLAEPPASLIVMDTNAMNDSPAIIWCDSSDVSHLGTSQKLRNPQTWKSYTEFFNFLLDNEAEERQSV